MNVELVARKDEAREATARTLDFGVAVDAFIVSTGRVMACQQLNRGAELERLRSASRQPNSV